MISTAQTRVFAKFVGTAEEKFVEFDPVSFSSAGLIGERAMSFVVRRERAAWKFVRTAHELGIFVQIGLEFHQGTRLLMTGRIVGRRKVLSNFDLAAQGEFDFELVATTQEL